MKYLNEDGLQVVADKINTRLKTVIEMPSTANDGAVRLYVGTDGTYLKGHIYKMVSNVYRMWRVSSRIVYTKGNTPSVGDIIYNWNGTVYTDSGDTIVEVDGTNYITSSNGMTYGNYGSQGEENWTDITADSGTADLNFDPVSENAQSGIAVSQALKQVVLDNTELDTWETMTWGGFSELENRIWNYDNNTYYSYGSNQYILNKSTNTWEPKTWNGFSNITSNDIWTDGNNVYYSDDSDQYILNKETDTWEPKTWYGVTNLIGSDIWTDGVNIYYSHYSDQYILNKETDTWEPKTWYGLTEFYGEYVWQDEDKIYYSSDTSNQYVLNKSTNTWEPKTWHGVTNLERNYIWTDGIDFYYSDSNNNYVLNKSTDTWESKTWYGLTEFYGKNIWTDGTNIYFSNVSEQRKLTRTIK